jgi:diacylglycerol O-acyltransferase / wax synthase
MQRVSGYDAAFLYDERPEEPQHTLKVAVWGREASARYSLERTRRLLAARVAELPPLRWRAVRVPLDLHHPVWVEDPELDVARHLHRLALPAPAGHRELVETISEIASCPLDPDRPLWELWMLEGYRGDRVVAVLKMCHALADGGETRELLERLYVGEPEAETARLVGEPLPGRAALVRDALRDRVRDLGRLPGLLRAAWRAWRREAPARPADVPRVSMFASPATPFAGPPSRRRSFDFASVPLDDARAIRHAFGTTINDVVVATVAGALRAYLRERDALPGLPTLAHMPASIRAPDELGRFGNRVTSRPIALPTHLADPVARLRAAAAATRDAKQRIARMRGTCLEDWMRFGPPSLTKLVGRGMRALVRLRPDLPGGVVVSSVKGPETPLCAPGGPIETLVSVGHVKYTAGLNVTVWSYADQLNFGLFACARAVPDLDHVAVRIAEAFAELRGAAGREHRAAA